MMGWHVMEIKTLKLLVCSTALRLRYNPRLDFERMGFSDFPRGDDMLDAQFREGNLHYHSPRASQMF